MESQNGFRHKRSTVTALIELIDQISSALDDKKSTIGIFIDLKKALDTINPDILIKKLEHYEIRGIANQWVICYLKNR